MKTCNTNYEASITDVLRHHLGHTPTKLVPIPTYPDTIVYEAQYPEAPVIFKAVDPDGRDPDGIALEAWVCEKVRALGVPGPRVLALDTSKSRFPGSYFIMQKAKGYALDDLELTLEAQRPYLRLLGRYLRQIHSVKLDGFGWLDEAHYRRTGRVRGSEDTWRSSVLKEVPASLEYLEREAAIDQAMIEVVHRLIADYGGFLDQHVEASLLHNDLGPMHVWIDPESEVVTSLVDFGEKFGRPSVGHRRV